MTEISKTKRQNQRGAAPAVMEPAAEHVGYPGGADTAHEQERARGQQIAHPSAQYEHAGAGAGTPAAKSIGEPPGSPSYYGSSPQQTMEESAEKRSGAYTRPGTKGVVQALKSIGDPPGSPSYYGAEVRATDTHAATAYAGPGTQIARGGQPIGDPPGSPSYFGYSGQSPSVRPAPQGPSSYTLAPALPAGVRAPNAARALATVGFPPGSAAYIGRMNRGRPGTA